MKKSVIFSAFVALMTIVGVQTAMAQDEFKHEVAISYGALSNSQILDVFEEAIMAPFQGGTTLKDDKFFGPISAEYFYHLQPWIGIGGILVYGQKKGDLYSDSDNKKIGEDKNTYLTVMPAAKFDWFRRANVGLYSKVGVGVTLRHDVSEDIDYDESNLHVNWQLTAIGVEVGSKQIRAFAELGTGEQGIFLGGIRCKF
ncbi:MAG: hypothetical protein IJK43_02705 [Prevotella sp.]|nr:hypothetical protein [Prevotella sp.]